ncbi:MAG TPA: DUF4178 domain-containing protein [Drouetiella sp.]
MAGNTGDPELPANGQPQDGESVVPPPPARKPLARNFECTNCGASVTVKYPGASLSCVCESCHAVIDVTNEGYKILSTYAEKTEKYKILLPLGSRGTLKGKKWEVIGFMCRSDVASLYYWYEYLLFNPYYGYRFLTEDKGHWNFVTMTKEKPEVKNTAVGFRSCEAAFLEESNQPFVIYNRGKSRVDFVLGEFYWRVRINTEVFATDYINPPRMLSSEEDNSEVVWSIGEYTPREEVEAAFNLQDKLPKSTRMYATKPSLALADWKAIWPCWLLVLVFLFCAQIYFSGQAENVVVSQFTGNFIPNQKFTDVTIPKFTINSKKSGNVHIEVNAPSDNSWFWLGGELVNNDTGDSYPLEFSCEYYHGVDSDGSWSEGSTQSGHTIYGVPGGDYYINFDGESGDFRNNTNQQSYNVTVTRGVPEWMNWFIASFFASMIPIWAWILMRRDEVARWANSDFNPYVSSGSSD